MVAGDAKAAAVEVAAAAAAFALLVSLLIQLPSQAESAHQAFRRDSGPPQWHHGAFHDVRDSVRSEVRRMLHSRAEVPFQVPLEVNVVLIGFQGDGGYRYNMDAHKFEEFLRVSFPTHRPLCLETGEPIDIEHHIVYNAFHAGSLELLELEKALKGALVPAGTARESDFGREVPLFELDATVVEPIFKKLYSYLFALEDGEYSTSEMDQPMPNALFVVNFDKVRLDPREKEIDPDAFKNVNIAHLSEEDMKKQEADYIYRYRYNGGGSSQVWLGSGRFLVIDLSAGPCTYGKIETEEGSVSIRTLPRLRNIMYPKAFALASDVMTHDMFTGQLASVIATAVEHVIAPDIRFETVDASTRLLIPIIVLHNHNRYNIMEKGQNYSIDIEEIEAEVKKMVHEGQEVVILGGSYSLHKHEKIAIAVSNAMRGHSLQETKKDGRYHVHTKTYLDGAILKEEMERSGDVLAAGLLEVADPSLSSKYFVKQNQMEEPDQSSDSVLKHKSLWDTYDSKLGFAKKRRRRKNQEGLDRTYGTRVIPVFVLSLADVDPHLMMEDDSLVWTSRDVVIVLQHPNEKIPLSYVSETERRHALPYQAQRHILAGLASAVGGLTAPYEKASHTHERAVVNWLWATGCHPFGPFSNTSHISQMLKDVALRNSIYGRVDATLHRTRDTSEGLQSFASDYLKTPLGEPIKGNKKNKTATELWLDKFYKKTTNLPEPFPHELVERLEKYLDTLEEQLVELSSLLYDHKLQEAHMNSTYIFQSMQFTLHYVERVLVEERDKMRCCSIEYKYPVQSSQTYIYGGILLAGFVVYFAVIFFASPAR